MNKDKPDKPMFASPVWTYVVYMVLAFWVANVWIQSTTTTRSAFEISYTRFSELLKEGRIAEIAIQGHAARGLLTDAMPLGPLGEEGARFKTRIPEFGETGLLSRLEEKGVVIRVESNEEKTTLWSVLASLLPWLLIIGIWFWIIRSMTRNIAGGGVGPKGELGKFLNKKTQPATVPEVTFADVAGQENAKREVTEVVEFLKKPEGFWSLGAEIPHGVLLMGPPGTGKTLLAKALAGEAGVPFFSITGSEFIEMFVGVGAARVRNLFDNARKQAPSIIFIDELDSIGRTRGTGLGGGHDEREQTLNQILAEMDGFGGHEAIIVLAATNRPDVLDPALLRPGRFDRHVVLDLPDRQDREAILKVHVHEVPLDKDVDLKELAAGTPGFSGADLKNLVNEATMLTARAKRKHVTRQHFDDARDKLLLGAERTLAIQPDERHRLAVHESGHTLVTCFLPNADPLQKVSIIPRGRALGVTQQLPEHERHTYPEDYLTDRLTLMLGGRAAEHEVLGTVSSGADDDIHQATVLARSMVARWGMSSEVGPVDLRVSEEHPFLGKDIAQPRQFSEHSAEAVDKAVREALIEAQDRATSIIRAHRTELDRLVAALEENETLDRRQIEECLGPVLEKSIRNRVTEGSTI